MGASPYHAFMKNRIYIYSLVSVLLVLLTACGSMGPKSIRGGRMEYNMALGRSDAEQLLVNIVKMRFLDKPVFLKVTSMTSNLSFQTEISTSTPEIFKSTAFVTTVSPSLTWKDNPTVTYEELTGADYVTQMLSPVPADTIVLLLQSWPADMVLPLALNEINNVNNVWSPIHPEIGEFTAKEHNTFSEVTAAIDFLDSQRTLEWSVTRSDASPTNAIETAILLNKPQDDITTKTVTTLLKNLGLEQAPDGTTRFAVEYGLESKNNTTIVFGTRSMQDILTFASMDVDIPTSMASAALVKSKGWKDRQGARLMHVKTSSYEPNNASVAVQYNGDWFYIQNDDLQTKATFLLIQILMGMQSGASSSGAPVLTIPLSS